MKKLKYLLSLVLFIIIVFGNTPRIYAIVNIDNDGNSREVPYGDSRLENAYQGLDYYDCYVPYNLTPKDVGGYATGVIATKHSAYSSGMSSSLIDRKFAYHPNYYRRLSNPTYQGCTVGTDSETDLQYVQDANGNKYYLSAIQEFYYNFAGTVMNGTFPSLNDNRGQIFDVILTDGTCIHFCVVDVNSSSHTNGGPMEKTLWDVQYSFAPVIQKQYEHIFQAASGNMLELAGENSTCAEKFRNKYNLSSEEGGVTIAYYRMYNAKISDAPLRAEGVGTELDFSYGDVSVNPTTSFVPGATKNGSTIVSEWELAGMPSKSKLLEEQGLIYNATRNGLTVGQVYNVTTIGDKIALFKEAEAFDKIRIFVVFLGLLLDSYAILLFVAMIFDKINTFIDISLVNILTFGKVKYDPWEDELNEGKSTSSVSSKKLIFSIIITLVVGVILISGMMMSFTGNIIYFFSRKFL